jgi:hypothetical protein
VCDLAAQVFHVCSDRLYFAGNGTQFLFSARL